MTIETMIQEIEAHPKSEIILEAFNKISGDEGKRLVYEVAKMSDNKLQQFIKYMKENQEDSEWNGL